MLYFFNGACHIFGTFSSCQSLNFRSLCPTLYHILESPSSFQNLWCLNHITDYLMRLSIPFLWQYNLGIWNGQPIPIIFISSPHLNHDCLLTYWLHGYYKYSWQFQANSSLVKLYWPDIKLFLCLQSIWLGLDIFVLDTLSIKLVK
jgi:hypothetical protein